MLLNNKYNYNPITDQIGEGGFGRVFKAYDTVLEQEVALKMVDSGKLSENYSLVKEVQKARRLMHENLIQYYDAFFLETETATGEILRTEVAVMEYIPGGSLQEFNWKAQPPEVQKELVKGILNGLGHLHKKGVIHRDIKPSNILIAKEDGQVIPKITDFGISKVRGAKSASVSRVVGSFAYMAPEQFEKEKRIDFNTDLWAFGILLYKLFLDELPFGEERTTSEAEIISNIVNQPLPETVEQIPNPFKKIIKRCLIKDRKERGQKSSELILILKKFIVKEIQSKKNYKDGATLVLDHETTSKKEENKSSHVNSKELEESGDIFFEQKDYKNSIKQFALALRANVRNEELKIKLANAQNQRKIIKQKNLFTILFIFSFSIFMLFSTTFLIIQRSQFFVDLFNWSHDVIGEGGFLLLQYFICLVCAIIIKNIILKKTKISTNMMKSINTEKVKMILIGMIIFLVLSTIIVITIGYKYLFLIITFLLSGLLCIYMKILDFESRVNIVKIDNVPQQ